jgi:hypothetical protein
VKELHKLAKINKNNFFCACSETILELWIKYSKLGVLNPGFAKTGDDLSKSG